MALFQRKVIQHHGLGSFKNRLVPLRLPIPVVKPPAGGFLPAVMLGHDPVRWVNG
jgi:hypothetical protein